MTHTQLPWRVGSGPNNEVEIFGPMRMNASPILASLEHEPRDANAAFIVKACNMHDELVRALDEVTRALSHHEAGPRIDGAKAILAKAREATP